MKKLTLCLILLAASLNFGNIFAYNSKKTKIKSHSEINLFCRKIQPERGYCVIWWETQQKLLELKDLIYQKIKKFCEENPKNKFCKERKKTDIPTFCSKVMLEDETCKEWQSLKQRELEIKGKLSDEIKNFCAQNPFHNFCR